MSSPKSRPSPGRRAYARVTRVLLLAIAGLAPSACGPAAIVALLASSGGGSSGGTPPPARPGTLTGQATTPTAVLLAWLDASGSELGFRIKRRTDPSQAFTEVGQVQTDVTSYTDQGLTPQTQYFYVVSSFNGGGETLSNEVSITTPAVLQIDSVTPESGLTAGGGKISLTGRGFESIRPVATLSVTIGGVPATSVDVVDDATATCVVPSGLAGAANVVVNNGFEEKQLTGGFTFFSSPPVFSLRDTRINTSTAGVATAADPEICCAGKNVYTLWEDSRSGVIDIYFNRSTDGGATWPDKNIRLDSDLPVPGTSTDPEMCCDGNKVYAVWSDIRNGRGDIYFNRSTDGGATWLENKRIDSGKGASWDPEICCDGDHVYVVWTDDRVASKSSHIFFNRSTDGGITWLPSDKLLDTAPDSAVDEDPEVCCQGSSVHVTWKSNRHDPDPKNAPDLTDIFCNRSTDAGATWLRSEPRLNTNAKGTSWAWNAEPCCDGNNVYVVWHDTRHVRLNVFLNRSTDGGVTWQGQDVRINSDGPGKSTAANPEICCQGEHVYVVWTDTRNGENDIYFDRSTDRGVTWPNPDSRLDDRLSKGSSELPRIACDASSVYVVWHDDRHDPDRTSDPKLRDIFFNHSTDRGASWAADTNLNRNSTGTATLADPQICIDGARIHVAWRDERDGKDKPSIRYNHRIPFR